MKAWKAALAAAVASAAIALIVVAPMAQSSKSREGLKIISTGDLAGSGHATAKCPRGFVVVGGGFTNVDAGVIQSQKDGERRWTVTVVGPNDKRARGASAGAQAVCAKGTGGFQVTDAGER